MIVCLAIVGYFLCLLGLSYAITRTGGNDAFFRAERRSPWFMVAFGMIGASISGVTFVSVPGMVLNTQMTYLQMCLGFIPGYFAVAFVLLPVYYKLRITTIYTYLRHRLGRKSYLTGSGFFFLSKLTGSAIKFYVVCAILQHYFLQSFGVPFPVTVGVLVMLIWLYTRRGGIRTLVFTDVFQTFCMLAALLLIVWQVMSQLNMSVPQAISAIAADSHSRIFVFTDMASTQNFFKQFLSGMFVVIVMTGLDQDMMQKNLTCKSLRDAQKDMCAYGFAFLPVNLLLLALGVLLVLLSGKMGMPLPAKSDDMMLMFAAGGTLGPVAQVLFVVGIVAACFSSADSALTSLTTSFCVDVCRRADDEPLRKRAHLLIALCFALFIVAFDAFNSTSLIDAVYTLCAYTYGPLLGMFAYGLFTRKSVADRWVPYVAIASPLVCIVVAYVSERWLGYTFGYEMLLINGMTTFAGLWFTQAIAGHGHESAGA